MNEKELRKLRRQDLLQLLLLQSQEMKKLQTDFQTLEQAHITMQESRARLMEKLEEKDAQLARLLDKLDEKDALLARLLAQLGGDAPDGPPDEIPEEPPDDASDKPPDIVSDKPPNDEPEPPPDIVPEPPPEGDPDE